MKNFKLLFFSILLISGFTVLGCSNPSQDNGSSGSNGNNPSSGSIVSLNTNNARNVCSSFITVNTGSARAATNSQKIKSLTYFENGINKPFTFKTSSGKEVLLTVSEVKQITDTIVAIKFNASWEVTEIVPAKPGMKQDYISVAHQENRWGQALVNLQTGEYFDFSGYEFENIKGNDKYIFAFSNNSLYKIDIKKQKKATPINVAEHDPLNYWNTLFYILDEDKILVTNKENGPQKNFIVYFYDSKKPRCTMGNLVLKTSLDDNLEIENDNIQYIQAKTGEIFALFNLKNKNNHNKQSAWGKVNFNTNTGNIELLSINKINEISIPLYNNECALYYTKINNKEYIQNRSSFHQTDNLLIIMNSSIYNKGEGNSEFIKITISSSGLTISKMKSSKHYSCTRMRWDDREADPIVVHTNGIYFMENNSIKYLNYNSQNSIATDLYTNKNLIVTKIDDQKDPRKFNLVNDTIIFYQYIDATTVGTYSIPITGLPEGQSPTLLSEYNAEVKDMVYLDF